MEDYDYEFAREVGKRIAVMTPKEIKMWSQSAMESKKQQPTKCCHCGDELLVERDWHPCCIDGCPNTLCSVCAFKHNNRCPEHKGNLIGYSERT